MRLLTIVFMCLGLAMAVQAFDDWMIPMFMMNQQQQQRRMRQQHQMELQRLREQQQYYYYDPPLYSYSPGPAYSPPAQQPVRDAQWYDNNT